MEFTHITMDMLKATQAGSTYLPVLTDAVIGLMGSGGIHILPHPYAVNGVYYSVKENRMYVDPKYVFSNMTIDQAKVLITQAKNYNKEDQESEVVKTIEKVVARMLAGICYFSMNVMGRQQNTLFINIEETKQWYQQFFYTSIFRLSDGRVASGLLGVDDPIPPLFEGTTPLNEGRTHLSKYTSDFWARKYTQMMLETFELPIYNGVPFTKSDFKKVYALISSIHTECYEALQKSEVYDHESLQGYKDWFKVFSTEYKTFFLNQYKRIKLTKNLFFAGNFHSVDLSILEEAYSHIAVAVDVNKYRFAAPICRELFLSSEPLAQATNALILGGRIKTYPQYQKIAAQGLSYIGQ